MYLEKVQEELERERSSSRGQVESPSNVQKKEGEGEEEILDTKRSETPSTCSIICENAYNTLKDRVAHIQRNNEL